MTATEKELVSQLAEAEKELQSAKKALAKAKKVWTECETNVISCQIHLDRVREALEKHRDTIPALQPEPSLHDQEIEEFRKNYPELCDLAKKRDLNKL